MKKKVALMLLLMLIVAAPVQAAGGLTNIPAPGFSDIENHWSKATVTWGAGLGIALGFPDGTFEPNATVTEAQFLAMLERTFTDTKDGNPWYKPYYDLAYEYNYPVANSPENIILRTQVAEIVAGTQGVNYTGDNAIQYLLGKGLAKGTDPTRITIASFEGNKTLTRAEAVQFIKNLKDAGIQEIKARPFEPSKISDLPALPVPEGHALLLSPEKEQQVFNTPFKPEYQPINPCGVIWKGNPTFAKEATEYLMNNVPPLPANQKFYTTPNLLYQDCMGDIEMRGLLVTTNPDGSISEEVMSIGTFYGDLGDGSGFGFHNVTFSKDI